MDYRPRHMPITHLDLYTTPYFEYAAEGLTGRTRVRVLRTPLFIRLSVALAYAVAKRSPAKVESYNPLLLLRTRRSRRSALHSPHKSRDA